MGGARRRLRARGPLRRGDRRLPERASSRDLATPAAQRGDDPRAGRRLQGRAAVVPAWSCGRGRYGRPGARRRHARRHSGDALPPGEIPGRDPVGHGWRRARTRDRPPARAGARLLPPPHRAHRDRASGSRCVPRARPADLRGARRPARAGARPQQPRHRGVLRGPVGRGARPLRSQQGGPDAHRGRRQRCARREQHRGDPQRPGQAGRGDARCSRKRGRSRPAPADSSPSPSRR